MNELMVGMGLGFVVVPFAFLWWRQRYLKAKVESLNGDINYYQTRTKEAESQREYLFRQLMNEQALTRDLLSQLSKTNEPKSS